MATQRHLAHKAQSLYLLFIADPGLEVQGVIFLDDRGFNDAAHVLLGGVIGDRLGSLRLLCL